LAAEDDDFERFYAATAGRLVGQVYAITGNLQEAEDAVQEAFVRASLRWGRIRNYDLPEAWVRRVAINLVRSEARRAGRRLRALIRHGLPQEVPGPSAGEDATVQLLEGLPLRYREVLVLYYLVGLSIEETAKQLGAPIGTVKARLSRGRKAVAARLGEERDREALGHD
jgi:RNA polymerase sigma-70 factor (ECF subfamily)